MSCELRAVRWVGAALLRCFVRNLIVAFGHLTKIIIETQEMTNLTDFKYGRFGVHPYMCRRSQTMIVMRYQSDRESAKTEDPPVTRGMRGI